MNVSLTAITRRTRLLAAIAAVAVTIVGRSPAQAQLERNPGERGWIGVTFGEAAGEGVVVREVAPGAPAERAGIRPGDTIIRWDGRSDVGAAIRETDLRPGTTVRVTIAREAEPARDVTVVAEARPAPVAMREMLRDLERSLEETAAARRRALDEAADATRRLMESRQDAALQSELLRLRVRSDSLWLRADSLQLMLREMLRDSLGPRAFERLRLGIAPRRRVDARQLNPEARLRRLPADPIAPGGPGSIGAVLAGGRMGVAGAELTDLGPGLASYFGASEGALVLRVVPETPAARAGLEDGDVIVAVAGQPVATVADVRQALAPARDGAEIDVIRHGALRTLTLRR